MRHLTRLELWRIRQDQEARFARENAKRQPKEKPARKLKAGFRARMIEALATILRRAEPTAFAFEGVMRSNIRARLCLKGWHWRDADGAAEDVVEGALARVGAVRPTWKQAQPEWTQDGVITLERFTCVNCGSLIPPEHRKYCSSTCYETYRSRIWFQFRREELKAEAEMDNVCD
ncbi:MAG: hypothetical protein B7Z15_07355 [Rhizobiales bacterium 32-66-8]|nr:MAG: hypothetical protein B7Z15_07355 [Rhizobiales bacterium 32-66-8]